MTIFLEMLSNCLAFRVYCEQSSLRGRFLCPDVSLRLSSDFQSTNFHILWQYSHSKICSLKLFRRVMICIWDCEKLPTIQTAFLCPYLIMRQWGGLRVAGNLLNGLWWILYGSYIFNILLWNALNYNMRLWCWKLERQIIWDFMGTQNEEMIRFQKNGFFTSNT